MPRKNPRGKHNRGRHKKAWSKETRKWLRLLDPSRRAA